MKNVLLIFICFASFQLSANMANPVIPGTMGGRPFVNQYVDVVHEDLFVKIKKRFEGAEFKVIYHVNSSKDSIDIPFLFYAYSYLDGFNVKVDGEQVDILPVPEELKAPEGTKFNDFSYFFELPSYSDWSGVSLPETSHGGRTLMMRDFIYFETDISKGDHVIEVTYTATPWVDKWDWVKKYSYRYALSPAKYWKSFGTLTIKLDATDCELPLSSNLGSPSSGSINSISIWEFDHLPIEIAQWTFEPEQKPTVIALLKIGPFGLALIISGFFVILNIIWLVWYRKRHPQKRFSVAVIFGSILIPSLFIFSWLYSYNVIDDMIGKDASREHGYNFLIVVLYPFIILLHWIFNWLIDNGLKRKLNN